MNSDTTRLPFRPKRILFVFNPGSGKKSKRVQGQVFVDFCLMNNIEFQLAVLGVDEIKGIFDRFKPDLVVAAGGDGTVNEAGKLVVNTNIPIGVIPMGSSNGFAKNLLIPANRAAAFDVLLSGHIKTIDTLVINNKHCFHLCDIGINAALIARSHHSKIRGMFVYVLNLLKELLTFHFFNYAVESPNQKLSGKAFAIVITNEKKFGTNAIINPGGKINDGLFEILVIKPFPVYKLINLVYKVFWQRMGASGFSIFLRVKKAVILNIDKEHVHIDGEPVVFDNEINITILPHSLHVLVPGNIH